MVCHLPSIYPPMLASIYHTYTIHTDPSWDLISWSWQARQSPRLEGEHRRGQVVPFVEPHGLGISGRGWPRWHGKNGFLHMGKLPLGNRDRLNAETPKPCAQWQNGRLCQAYGLKRDSILVMLWPFMLFFSWLFKLRLHILSPRTPPKSPRWGRGRIQHQELLQSLVEIQETWLHKGHVFGCVSQTI